MLTLAVVLARSGILLQHQAAVEPGQHGRGQPQRRRLLPRLQRGHRRVHRGRRPGRGRGHAEGGQPHWQGTKCFSF